MVHCAAYNCAKHEQSEVEADLPFRGTYVRYFAVYGTIRYDMKSVMLTEDAIPTIFDKLGYDKPIRFSSFMEKLNRKRVCLSDNRVILGEKSWTFTSSRIRE